MLKLDYSFRALTPIHTGSDENTGTERKLRREKILLKQPITYLSKFKTHEEKREALLSILQHIWKSIDFEGMQKGRLMSIWDEFTSKVLASTQVKTKEQFLNTISAKMGIRALANDYSDNIAILLQNFNDYEFLDTLRNELQYLMLKLKVMSKKKETVSKNLSLFAEPTEEAKEEIKLEEITRHFEHIPFISGNSIRGMLRRVVMADFCKRVGIESLDKSIYHQLFTGGNITDSTGKESLENREKFIKMCPMIGLLGAAIGNQTIEGELKVSGARPKCLEHGTGAVSFWELIETKFQTRLDSSKTEKDIELVNDMKKDATTQMIYQYEVFIVGTEFNSNFTLTTEDHLLTSAFWHMLSLFKENNFIGGNSARDSGLIDLSSLEIPEGATDLYTGYLDSNKEEIQKYFKSSLALSFAE